YRTQDYLLDPHTAVGLSVMQAFREDDVPLVLLATAHPAKFEDSIREALPEVHAVHPTLEALRELPTRKTILELTEDSIKAFIVRGGRE
ncbi:MAG: threonine synthase, partial [SAR86 cluster bacterium]|nr:threonine synthase [SAR86 cluster bacterium]